MTEEQEVREGIVNAFQHLLSEELGWRADIEGLHLNRLNSCEAEVLELPFIEEEIHSAPMEMNGDKAPGPDGFTVTFWQACWDFCEGGDCGAEDLGDFRSISLLRGLYKLLAKVLSNRLKKVLEKVVSVDQNAFVRGKQILNASLIANEVCLKWALVSVDGVDLVVYLNCQILCPSQWGACRLLLKQQGVAARRSSFSLSLHLGLQTSGEKGVEMIVSHLLFADDTIIFCKSVLILVGEVEEIEEMAMELGVEWEKGGLCIRKIDLLNKALLGKWIWRFASEKDNLWKRVIGVKYGQEGFGWRTEEARGTFGVGVGLKPWSRRLESQIFWRFNDWELDLIRDLFNMLRNFRISSEEDSVFWKGGGHGIFEVKDAYNLLVVPNACAFPNKCIWVDKAPTKVAFFAWETTWGKILTLDRLKKMGVAAP
ncbi:hypothetical protein CK203_019816 [Vitis vinifera]|uniref:Reverse transcriptase zinc-binding domain-containing protein n=1 Tax=Vitis vinifera TaxID=29760 RepID=A0A438J3C3_VITVI|nr:hypothetical protein CK203_019816 [Vitis vinifera]